MEAAGLLEDAEVQTTGLFSRTSPVIENVSNTDTFPFTQGMISLDVGQVSEVIVARDNLYIGVVTEIVQPTQQSFEEAREKVESNATILYKNGPEYIGKLTEYVTTILEESADRAEIQEIITSLALDRNENQQVKLN